MIRLLIAALLGVISALCVTAQPSGDSVSGVRKKFVKLSKVPNKALCVNDRTYSPQQLDQMKPFASAAQVKLVSYFKIKSDKTTDQIISLITEEGKFEPAKWQ